MMNNVMMRNMMTENNIEEKTPVEEEVKTEKVEKDTFETVSSYVMTCLPLILSLVSDSGKEHNEIKCLHEKIHDLDKRVAVCEALIKDKK